MDTKQFDWAASSRHETPVPEHGISWVQLWFRKELVYQAVVVALDISGGYYVVPNAAGKQKTLGLGPLSLEEAKSLADTMNAMGVPEEWK